MDGSVGGSWKVNPKVSNYVDDMLSGKTSSANTNHLSLVTYNFKSLRSFDFEDDNLELSPSAQLEFMKVTLAHFGRQMMRMI